MITSFQIRNYKCFRDVSIEDPGKINVLVGDNSSGKTALLEALFMPGGDPQLMFRNDALRSIQYQVIARSRAEYETLWAGFFHNFSQEQPIIISLKGTPPNQRELKILATRVESKAITIIPKHQGEPFSTSGQESPQAIVPLTFQTTDDKGRVYRIQPLARPDGTISIEGEAPPTAAISFNPANNAGNSASLAQGFSTLSIRNQDRLLVETIRSIFPSVRDLTVQTANGGIPSLYCSIEGLSFKMPVGAVSAGLLSLLGYLIGIALNPNGVTLIDEIENGIYFRNHTKLWEAINRFGAQYNCQLYVSTHSGECLQGLLPIIRNDPDDFRLFRIEQSEPGTSAVRAFKGKDFQAALETGTEFR